MQSNTEKFLPLEWKNGIIGRLHFFFLPCGVGSAVELALLLKTVTRAIN